MSHPKANAGSVNWYAVRCLFEADPGPSAIYEERITLWRASGFDDAIAMAESEAQEYAATLDTPYLGLAQCYALGEDPSHGAEVFSLMRESSLDRETYLTQFFDTGSERQQNT